jgi:hypothetical protein
LVIILLSHFDAFQRELLCVQLHRLDSRTLLDVHLLEAVVREQRPE